MLIKVKRGWELSENRATPEKLFVNRRQISKAIAAGSLLSTSALLATSYKTAAYEKSIDSPLINKLVPINKKFVLDDLDNELIDWFNKTVSKEMS